MDDLRERVAYLQGLAEGLKFEEGKDEARVLKKIIDILADLIDKVEEVQAAQEDLEDYLESIDEDLYGDEDEEEDEDGLEDDEESGTGPAGGGQEVEIEIESEDEDEISDSDSDEELNYVEVECQNCHDIICFEEDLLAGADIVEITCPNCNQVVFVNDGSMPPPQGSGKAKKDPARGEETEDI
ncbi:MAG: CD1247 N-terminal domain-containing protein [Thermacetogeniaceae bacterium]